MYRRPETAVGLNTAVASAERGRAAAISCMCSDAAVY